MYEILIKVEYGKRTTYSRLAEKAGYPNAGRAVGSTMAKNRFPLIIPCHRVIKSNGDIGQFGYGKDYKSRMLELEVRN